MPAAMISPAALNRSIMADGWLDVYFRSCQRVLAAQARDVAHTYQQGQTVVQSDVLQRWRLEMIAVQAPLMQGAATDGAALAGAEMGSKTWNPWDVWDRVEGKDAPARIPPPSEVLEDGTIVWPVEEELLVERRLRADVGKHLQDVSRLETETSAAQYGNLFERAAKERWIVRDTVKAILSEGMAKSKARADLMARTETIWAYNHGALLQYQDDGVAVKQWLLTQDDATCEWCRGLRDEQAAIGQPFLAEGMAFRGVGDAILTPPFDIEHPPLHPRCRCSIVPVV